MAVIAYDRAGNVSGRYQDNWIFIFIQRFLFMPFMSR
jgi:hypothetical protein